MKFKSAGFKEFTGNFVGACSFIFVDVTEQRKYPVLRYADCMYSSVGVSDLGFDLLGKNWRTISAPEVYKNMRWLGPRVCVSVSGRDVGGGGVRSRENFTKLFIKDICFILRI